MKVQRCIVRAPTSKYSGLFLFHLCSNANLMSFNHKFCFLGAVKRKSQEKRKMGEQRHYHGNNESKAIKITLVTCFQFPVCSSAMPILAEYNEIRNLSCLLVLI